MIARGSHKDRLNYAGRSQRFPDGLPALGEEPAG